METDQPLLEVKNLEKYFGGESFIKSLMKLDESDDRTYAVDGISFDLYKDQTIGIIGESGCGKTTLLETLMGLNKPNSGEIYYKGEPLSEFNREEWKQYRREVQYIFQDPYNSFDPKKTIRWSLMEPMEVHSIDDKEEKLSKVLERVKLTPPGKYLDQRPGSLSGGERQRASIARALIMEPEVICADEPTSMLDVSIQASILNLLKELKEEMGMSVLYVSHDLSTVSYLCEKTCVMYLGKLVEKGPTREIVENPKHPYTQALLNAIPVPNPYNSRERTRLVGGVGALTSTLRSGCRFRDRCPEAMKECEHVPAAIPVDTEREVSCHLYKEPDKGISRGQEASGREA